LETRKLIAFVQASSNEEETTYRFETLGTVLLDNAIDYSVVLVTEDEDLDEAVVLHSGSPSDLLLLLGQDLRPATANWLDQLVIGLGLSRQVHDVGAAVPHYLGFLVHKPAAPDLVNIKGSSFLFSEGDKGLLDRCILTTRHAWGKADGFLGSDSYLAKLNAAGMRSAVVLSSTVAYEVP
jgi:hypothetical protein